uniref:Protein SspM n=1 Tax=Mycolicibacterium phlei TaxID=1771 RepID=SSPM_MYCPH|nr:RecName: Full=Protein SspM [Mycolicibacterium phlei]
MANYQNASNRNSSNKLVAPGAQAAIDQMKFEIASEFGVNLGPDNSSSRRLG